MAYVLIKNEAVDTYPYTLARLCKDNPNVSFPKSPSDNLLSNWGIYPVMHSPQPSRNDITVNVVEGTPEKQVGVWTQVWNVTPASAEEIAGRQAEVKTEAERLEIKKDTFVSNFITMSPTEVDAYVNANVTDLASAKKVLNKMARMLLLLARAEFGE